MESAVFKREGGGCLTPFASITFRAGAAVSVLTAAEKRRAFATVLARVPLTGLQWNSAVWTSVQLPILRTVRALASVIAFVSYTNTAILTWTVFACVKVLERESICLKKNQHFVVYLSIVVYLIHCPLQAIDTQHGVMFVFRLI